MLFFIFVGFLSSMKEGFLSSMKEDGIIG